MIKQLTSIFACGLQIILLDVLAIKKRQQI